MVIVRPNKNIEYERCEDLVWINGVISKIEERLNKNRKFKDQETGEYKTREVEEVRFVFDLEGYQYAHRSRWMTKSVAEKSNLYAKYLKELIPGLQPNSAVDLDRLIGKEVKTMWDTETGKDGREWQHIKIIKPIDLTAIEEVVVADDIDELNGDKQLPF